MLTVEEKLWLLRAFKKIGFFSMCTDDEIKQLIPLFTKNVFPKGKEIIKQGGPGDFFFIIGKGKVSIIDRDNNKTIAVLTDGDHFGEIALINDKPRDSSVVADEISELYLLFRIDFEKLLMDNPKLKEYFSRVAEERTTQRNNISKKEG